MDIILPKKKSGESLISKTSLDNQLPKFSNISSLHSDSSNKNQINPSEHKDDKDDKDDRIIVCGTNVAIFLLEIKNQLKILHWQSDKYSEHKTLDHLFDLLTEKNDKWVETFMGKYGKIKLSTNGEQITLVDISNMSMSLTEYLLEVVKNLNQFRLDYFSDQMDSDLNNIFDEIIADVNRAKYLLELN